MKTIANRRRLIDMRDAGPLTQNLGAFREHAPGWLFDRLAGMTPPPLSITGEAAKGTLNLDLGHTHLYRGDAAGFAEGQVARYVADPKRIFINPPPVDSDWVKGERTVYEATAAAHGDLPPPVNTAEPEDWPSAALISFGIGLGLHLPLLVERLPFRDLVLAEPHVEFLFMSLQVLDWQALFNAVGKHGGKVRFVIADDAATIANGVFDALRKDQFGLIDGSFGFRHYQSPTLDAADKLFREMAPGLGSSLGFVEDECIMIQNALANLAKPGMALVGPASTVQSGCPVLVVGSGPSLDADIEHVRRFSRDAIVIGAGTGTSALLENGIVPDLHCEVENVARIYDGFLILTERHDLSTIPFLGSVTVDPRIPGLFGPGAFYFRDSVTSSLLLAGETGILDHSAPTVANLACRAAVLLGASGIYLFGVDLGGADPARHHSSAAYYSWTDDAFWSSGANTEAMAIPVPGNFRETVHTNLAFLHTRTFFNAFCAAYPEMPVVNCSDGARIEGAAPIRAADIEPASAGDETGEAVGRLFAASPAKSERDIDTVLADYGTALAEFHDAFRVALSGPDSDFVVLYDRCRPLLFGGETVSEGPEVAAARACHVGTLLLLLQYGYAHARRLPGERRGEFTTWYAGAMRTHLDTMQAAIEKALLT